MGQRRQLEAAAAVIHAGNTIQECHLLGPGNAALELLELPSHRCWGAMESSSSLQVFSSLPRLAGHASAEGGEGACAKEELADFTQPDTH